MVLANNIPNSNELEDGAVSTTEGSTYATGNLIPDAFSIRFIPSTLLGNRFIMRSKMLADIIFF